MFTMAQLSAFVAVAEELHFGRAALRLQMTQPPLSRTIQNLERDLGVSLLVRDHRSVDLTPAGRALLPEARRILTAMDRATTRVKRIAAGIEGQLSIGFTATSALRVLGPIVDDMSREFPGVAVDLMEDVTANQLSSLDLGTLDLALIRSVPADEKYRSRVIHQERLLAAIPTDESGGELSGGSIEVRRFAHQNVIMYDPVGAKYFDSIVRAALDGVPVRPVQRVAQVHSMLAMVAARKAMALVPESARVLRVEGVSLRPVAGWDHPAVQLRAAWLRESQNPALARALRDVPSLAAVREGDAEQVSRDAKADLDQSA